MGVFDFNAKKVGISESDMQMHDAHANLNVVSDASSRTLLRNGQFPHKVMGTALFEVGEILGSRGNVGSKSLQTGGAVYAHIERCREDGAHGKFRFQLRALKLKNAQNFGMTSSPFFEMSRKVERPTGATWCVFFFNYRGEVNPSPHVCCILRRGRTRDNDGLYLVCGGGSECQIHMACACVNHISQLFFHSSSFVFFNKCNYFLFKNCRVKVYNSNVARADLHPVWKETQLDIEAICNGDLDRAMKINIWDHRRGGRHRHMGEFETTINGLLHAKEMDANGEGAPFEVRKHEKTVGFCEVKRAAIIGGSNGRTHVRASMPSQVQAPEKPEFIDYLTGGCQISLAVAIDFTASNGDPRQEGTPHYFHPPASKEWNDYEKAIFAVGSILAKYDTDQKFPVWGFGAKYNNVVRHCFQCGTEVEVEGVQGIMDAYRGVFRTPLTMSYPTKFTEVISTAASYARHEQVSSNKFCDSHR